MTPDPIPPPEIGTVEVVGRQIKLGKDRHQSHRLLLLTVEDLRKRGENSNAQGHIRSPPVVPCHPVEVEGKDRVKGPNAQINSIHYL